MKWEDKKLTIKQLNDHLYLLDESHETTGYLLIGQEIACMIDTMMGYHNYYEEARKLTDKPIVVINTHGHVDHILGNAYFDRIYIHPDDLLLAQNTYQNTPEFIEACKELGLAPPPFEMIREGDVLDLGGLTLKVYDLPGHTKGSIVLLCPEDRILFTGDAINHHLWMQLEHSLPMTEMADNLERLFFLENEADWILHGHTQGLDDISLMRSLCAGAREIAAGKTEKDLPYHWFGGESRQHPFAVNPEKKFQVDQHVICYETKK